MISIIVPVFNTARFLRQCIESILAQSYKNFELILVDDGSSDSSGEICDEYGEKDNRIIVIHKKNEGVCAARNIGVAKSHGDWIMFCDSDDYWTDNNILSVLIEKANEFGADIVRGEYLSVDENNKQIEITDLSFKKEFENSLLTPIQFINNCICGYYFLVLCLIRKEIIFDIRFDQSQIFLEDMKFLMQVLSKDVKCLYVNTKFYAYRKFAGSASNRHSIRKLIDSINMSDFFMLLSNKSHDNDFKDFCIASSVYIYYSTLQTIALPIYYHQRKQILRDLNIDKRSKDIRKRINDHSIKLNWRQRILTYLSPSLAIKIFFIGPKIKRKLNKL